MLPLPGPFCSRLPLVLASASPRRQEFLRLLGLDFAVFRPAGIEPRPLAKEDPAHYALRAAEAKARAAKDAHPRALILGADTVVALEGKILGKPRNREDAERMLIALAGKSHDVISACCCLPPDGPPRRVEGRAQVRFAAWPPAVLANYAATDEVMDKAGAYAVQGGGAFLADRIEGSHSAVIGLPLAELAALLLELGAIAPR